MATNAIKIKTSVRDEVTRVRVVIKHPMHTGLVKDKKTKKIIPAHFIKEVVCEHNGKVVMSAYCGFAISANPYMSFKIKDAKSGDSIKVSWIDNKKDKGTKTITIV